MAALPLCMELHLGSYTTVILGTAYGYIHPAVHQLFEFRYLPILAMLSVLASLACLIFGERHPMPLAKMFFAIAIGALGFTYFRLMLLAPFSDNQVWFVFWEEITELLYIAGVFIVLLIFREALFAKKPEARSQ